MRSSKVIGTVSVLAATALYLFSAVSISPGKIHNIRIDTASPLHIVWPFEISVVDDMGQRGLRIGPKVGRGWRGEAGGEATYRFYVPNDGIYYIWAYCLWYDACSNAIFAEFDNLDKAIIGNDPIYNQWHWARAFSVHLEKGTHTLKLSNHSDNIALQTLFLTNSALETPDRATNIFADIFYDGFDGCDQGNFAAWQQISGKWTVRNPFDATNTTENVLIGESDKTALIILKPDQWSNYSLNLSVQSLATEDSHSSVGICFGVTSPDDYYQLNLSRSDNKNIATAGLIRNNTENMKTLNSFQIPWQDHCWHDIQITLQADGIALTIDNQKPLSIATTDKITGGIGLRLEGTITAYFDNVHIRHSHNLEN